MEGGGEEGAEGEAEAPAEEEQKAPAAAVPPARSVPPAAPPPPLTPLRLLLLAAIAIAGRRSWGNKLGRSKFRSF